MEAAKPTVCSVHKRDLDAFCLELGCGQRLICSRCPAVGQKHAGHSFITVEDFSQNPMVIIEGLVSLKNEWSKCLFIDPQFTSGEAFTTAEDRIDKLFDDLRSQIEEKLNEERTKLKERLSQLSKQHASMVKNLWDVMELTKLKGQFDECNNINYDPFVQSLNSALTGPNIAQSLSTMGKIKTEGSKFQQEWNMLQKLDTKPLKDVLTRSLNVSFWTKDSFGKPNLFEKPSSQTIMDSNSHRKAPPLETLKSISTTLNSYQSSEKGVNASVIQKTETPSIESKPSDVTSISGEKSKVEQKPSFFGTLNTPMKANPEPKQQPTSILFGISPNKPSSGGLFGDLSIKK
eukprot:TRINITY_DN6216_c0_g1_i4.p1 TRINITY_DN6216_c0_g1~~TRINITY_DN6216_c0_g1_i4.p1  ORF type:complete len:346 (+),score=51.44 TRINITY_DN6216_c0_g1_i4:116-1153(+)